MESLNPSLWSEIHPVYSSLWSWSGFLSNAIGILTPSTGVAQQTGSGTGTGNNNNPPPPTGNSTPPNGVIQLASGTPIIGMYFFHPTRLLKPSGVKPQVCKVSSIRRKGGHTGSISMVTDGAGRMMTDTSGASQLTYKPYGEVNRMNSYGPDIFRYKYTGQQDDQDTGLYFYKARYYGRRRWVCDQVNGWKVLGVFTSADTVTNATSSFGLNHYMYVEGNPVRYADSSGKSIEGMILGAIIGYFLAEQNPQWGISKEQGAFLGAYAMSGNTNIGKDITGGFRLAGQWLRWASGGLQAAGDTYNLYSGSRKYQGNDNLTRSDLGNSSFSRSDIGKLLRVIFNPLTYIGIGFLMIDLTVGNVYNLLTGRGLAELSYKKGAFVVRNSGTQNFLSDYGLGSGAFVPAPFIFADEEASRNGAIMAHEFGHIKQFYDWDPVTYNNAFAFRRMRGVDYKHQEWNADARSGQVNYYGQRRDTIKWIWAMQNSNGDPLMSLRLFLIGDYVLDTFFY